MGLGGGYSEGSGEKMSEMTGLERLRALGREQEERSWSTVGKVRGRLMLQIAEQIEDERLREQLAVERVVSEMELHCLGVEGMDDSPVARWARELRVVLGGHVGEVTDVATIRKYAYEWVEAHGGLDAMVELSSHLTTVDALRVAVEETCTRLGVEHTGDLTQDAQTIWREIGALRSRLKESVPRATYERHLARRQRQIDESHEALRRKDERIEELNRELVELEDICDGESVKDTLEEALNLCATIGCEPSSAVGEELIWALGKCTDIVSKRLMPKGMEWLVDAWPRFEDDSPLGRGDEVMTSDGTIKAEELSLTICDKDGGVTSIDFGERVKRPAPEDSWGRLEEDVSWASCPDVYCARRHIDASDTSYERATARDIVRRAKALAGVSE